MNTNNGQQDQRQMIFKEHVSPLRTIDKSPYQPVRRSTIQQIPNPINHNGQVNQSRPERQSFKPLEKIVFDLNDRLEKLTRKVEAHQLKFQKHQDAYQQSTLIPKIITQLSETKLFNELNNSNREIYQGLYYHKMEIKTLKESILHLVTKDELAQQLKKIHTSLKQDYSTIEQRIKQSVQNNYNQELITHIDQFIVAKDSQLMDIITELHHQIQTMKIVDKTLQMKAGPIRTVAKPIAICYIQQFTVQGKQLNLNQINYFLDREGYLVDVEGRYLLNKSAKRVKLQQKHLQILKNNKILM